MEDQFSPNSLSVFKDASGTRIIEAYDKDVVALMLDHKLEYSNLFAYAPNMYTVLKTLLASITSEKLSGKMYKEIKYALDKIEGK